MAPKSHTGPGSRLKLSVFNENQEGFFYTEMMKNNFGMIDVCLKLTEYLVRTKK